MTALDGHLIAFMKRYRNLSGNSGVAAFEIGDDSIVVQFADGGAYLYNYASTGRDNIEKMKTLAMSGKGLSTFISRFIRGGYALKIDP